MSNDRDADAPVTGTAADWLESRRGFFIGVATVLSIALLLIAGIRNPVDYDGYWHLRMGMDWFANGLSPWIDHYSFTFSGEPVKGVPYPFQLALYGLVSVFGEQGGMIALKLIMFAFVLLCMSLWLKSIQAPALGWVAGLLLLVVALELKAQVRPELIGYGFLILAFWLYRRTGLECTRRAMVPILLLMLLWSNYHSPVFGYVVFSGLFLDIGLRLLREKAPVAEWVRAFAWGLAILLVGVFRPGFGHPLLGMRTFMAEWKPHIQEFTAPTFMLDTPIPYLLMPVAAVLLIALLLQRKFGLLVVTAIFTYAALTIGRMVAPAALVCAVLIPLVYRDALRTAALPARKVTRTNVYNLGMTVLAVATLATGFWFARAMVEENRYSWTLFPSAMVEHMQKNGKSGRIFNHYATGGYLIYKLSPDSKVFIDGRTNILYPVSHYLAYQAAMNDPDAFLQIVDRYDVDYAVLGASKDSASLMHFADWSLDFVDVNYLLFQPEGGDLHHFGKLLAQPYCWSDERAAGVAEELAYLQTEAGRAGLSSPLMRLGAAYVSADRPGAWIDQVGRGYNADDAGRRFVAARALDAGAWETAVLASERIAIREPRDDLVPVIARGMAEDWPQAVAYMERAAARPWRFVLDSEKMLQARAINWLSSNTELTASLVTFRNELGLEFKEVEVLPTQPMTANLCLY